MPWVNAPVQARGLSDRTARDEDVDRLRDAGLALCRPEQRGVDSYLKVGPRRSRAYLRLRLASAETKGTR
jgi:hypothetical protein